MNFQRRRLKHNPDIFRRLAENRSNADSDKYNMDDYAGENEGDYQTPELQEGNTDHARPWDGRGGRLFQFPGMSRYAPRPVMPRRYTRGRHTADYVNRHFKNTRNYDKPLLELEEGSERRLWISASDIGGIIGYHRSKLQALEREFNVDIRVAKSQDGDTLIGVIITTKRQDADKMDDVNAARKRILDTLSGAYREPEVAEEDSDDEADERQSDLQNPDNADELEQGEVMKIPERRVSKKIYHIHPDVMNMGEDFVQDWRLDNNEISVELVQGEHQPLDETKPCLTFEHAFHFSRKILQKLDDLGFAKPSPIQSQLWPLALSGHDVIGISQTGSGKTLAFLAPLVAHLLHGGMCEQNGERMDIGSREPSSPLALIIAPARELANQIADQCRKVFESGEGIWLSGSDQDDPVRLTCLEVTGGRVRGRSHIEDQKRLIEQENPMLIVGTPGRLIDLIENEFINTSRISFVVMDEADRLLERGNFELDMKKLLGHGRGTKFPIARRRQTILTSATWGAEIQRIARRYMFEPYKVQIGKLDLTPAKSVKIELKLVATEPEKFKELFKFINKLLYGENGRHSDSSDESGDEEREVVESRPNFKVIIFCSRRDTVDHLYSKITSENRNLASITHKIHGEHDQNDRERSMDNFRNLPRCLLVATDVASRGIDVDDVSHVFNYDMPTNIESFVHRVGRTGRAGRSGESLTLFHKTEDFMKSVDLRQLLKSTETEIPGWLNRLATRASHKIQIMQIEGKLNKRNF